ncbi:zinc-dependent alcohol dehydrogenase [Larsenimonas salina]|uniref:zinc-dependent alcohol dehydrogenase n=1 Tax=Larsenimonas salina TaxID=1295565 RepID=UPI002073EE62|nr:zinc-binding alcohol dehydrogenase [Larsenimonas salina]MCM5703804.1 zinc-binding alcohol dehydrogenase [Larsenimonas salina]
MTTHHAQAFWITHRRHGELIEAPLPGRPEGTLRVKTLYSGISKGTEGLVFNERVPSSEFERMQAPFQEGTFPFPIKYGYNCVGTVIEGPAHLLDKTVFALHPHQDVFDVPSSSVVVVPDDVPAERAILAANMETALNGCWDAAPLAGERITVIGAGVVGALVAYLCSKMPGTDVEVVDPNKTRCTLLSQLNLHHVLDQSEASGERDLIIHASGRPEGLCTALELAGMEARIIEMSWYGNTPVEVPLGQAFHAKRLTLRSSQVGALAPCQKPRWDYGRRLAKALDLLNDPILDHLISGESLFSSLPKRYGVILDDDATLCHRIRYTASPNDEQGPLCSA